MARLERGFCLKCSKECFFSVEFESADEQICWECRCLDEDAKKQDFLDNLRKNKNLKERLEQLEEMLYDLYSMKAKVDRLEDDNRTF